MTIDNIYIISDAGEVNVGRYKGIDQRLGMHRFNGKCGIIFMFSPSYFVRKVVVKAWHRPPLID